MDDATIKAIDDILSEKCADRVELIPTKDGVKIIRVKRREIKVNKDPTSKR